VTATLHLASDLGTVRASITDAAHHRIEHAWISISR
jgi:hypothetical protein